MGINQKRTRGTFDGHINQVFLVLSKMHREKTGFIITKRHQQSWDESSECIGTRLGSFHGTLHLFFVDRDSRYGFLHS